MKRNRIVTAQFKAKEHKGAFKHTFSEGQQIAFCRYVGDDQSGVVFARIGDIAPVARKEDAKRPRKEYEVDRAIFEWATKEMT